MERGFWVAASALNSHQRALDVVGNNIANIDTTGFKASRALFSDVFSQTLKLGGAVNAGGTSTVNPIQVGYGAEITAISKNFNQGDLQETGRSLDLALTGPGFFTFRPETGAALQPYYSRSGHLSIDANAGVNAPPASPAGPITLVSSQGYTLQGINATIDPLTGQYTLAAAAAAYTDITFDENASIGPFATSTGTLANNLDSSSPLAIDPMNFEMSTLGVDRSYRLESRRASLDVGTDSYFYFTVQNPVQNAPGGDYTTLVDGVTGQDIKGVIGVDQTGNVIGVYEDPAIAGDYLSAAQVAALTPWANVNGLGRPIFTIGTAPVAVVAETNLRPAIPANVPLNLTDAAPFTLIGGGYDAGTLSIVSNGRTMVGGGVDYTENNLTGVITPTTAWNQEDAIATYTRGAVAVTNQANPVTNANANIDHFTVDPNLPIEVGTLVVNSTRNGAALVEDTDYSVDYQAGTITPITYWDATTPVTVSYTQADTRMQVEHNLAGFPSAYRDISTGGSEGPTIRSAAEIRPGTSMSAIDSLGNEHFLQFGFERLADREWSWQATPTYRYSEQAVAINDSGAGGGLVGTDGMTVMPDTLIANADGTFQIEISIDEGNGLEEWKQIASAAAFPASSGSSRYFKVVDDLTGEIAFSRDVTTTSPDFSVFSMYKSKTSAGDGTLVYSSTGVLDAAQSLVINPITLAPLNAAVMDVTMDFSGITETAAETDVVSTGQNGFVSGELEKWSFNADGIIEAEFSNGLIQNIARVGLTSFANPEGLQARGETHFQASSSSGAAQLFFADASTPMATGIRPGALEISNVDISAEMANMIIFQRSYQFNSRIITTIDEMTKEAIALKR